MKYDLIHMQIMKLCFIAEQNNWMKFITKQTAILTVKIFEWKMTVFFEISDLLKHNS
jgi:hypothetical protein